MPCRGVGLAGLGARWDRASRVTAIGCHLENVPMHGREPRAQNYLFRELGCCAMLCYSFTAQ